MPEEQTVPPPVRADAVLIRRDKISGTFTEKLQEMHRRFGPVVGVVKGCVFPESPKGWNFYAPTADQTVNLPLNHQQGGQPRYTWTEVEDGVKHGILTDAARADQAG